MDNKTFYYALILSVLVHVAFISYFSAKKLKARKKPLKQIEVTYQSVKPKAAQTKKLKFKDLKVVKDKTKPNKVKFKYKKVDMTPTLKKTVKDMSKLTGKINLDQKLTPRIATLDKERKITIPLFKSEKITNPRYLTYNENIRQKIRDRAYFYVDSPEFNSGKVYLTFVLMNDGQLRQIKVREDRTVANESLKAIGVKSIQESNPFPPFPKDLNYPELSFNVVISFEVDQ